MHAVICLALLVHTEILPCIVVGYRIHLLEAVLFVVSLVDRTNNLGLHVDLKPGLYSSRALVELVLSNLYSESLLLCELTFFA